MRRRIGEHAKRSQNDEVPPLRFATAVAVVHQERIGREFCGQSNGLALAWSEDTWQ